MFKTYFIGLLIVLMAAGCNSAPDISWVLRQTRASELSICQGTPCPELSITYPYFMAKDSVLGRRLNALRDSLIIQTLYLGSDRPNFDLDIAQSMQQYLWVGLDYKPELLSADAYSGQIKVDVHRQNKSLLVLELSGRLILPQGPKEIHSKHPVNLNKNP